MQVSISCLYLKRIIVILFIYKVSLSHFHQDELDKQALATPPWFNFVARATDREEDTDAKNKLQGKENNC